MRRLRVSPTPPTTRPAARIEVEWIEIVVACVVREPGYDVSADELIAHARQTLAPFKVPKRVEFVTDLPRNTAGELLERILRGTFST